MGDAGATSDRDEGRGSVEVVAHAHRAGNAPVRLGSGQMHHRPDLTEDTRGRVGSSRAPTIASSSAAPGGAGWRSTPHSHHPAARSAGSRQEATYPELPVTSSLTGPLILVGPYWGTLSVASSGGSADRLDEPMDVGRRRVSRPEDRGGVGSRSPGRRRWPAAPAAPRPRAWIGHRRWSALGPDLEREASSART